jgi:hypothetical protein
MVVKLLFKNYLGLSKAFNTSPQIQQEGSFIKAPLVLVRV